MRDKVSQTGQVERDNLSNRSEVAHLRFFGGYLLSHGLFPLTPSLSLREGVTLIYFTVFTNGASPWMRTSRRSPDSMGPTPLGVPVRMMSPGSKVMLVEMKLTS